MKNESPHRGLKAAGAEAEIEQSQFTASPRSLQLIARALGGEVNGGEVRCPGPGHSAIDRSLSIKLDSNAPDGFLVHSFSPADDPIVCRDYVREKVGLPAFKPNGRGRASDDAIDKAVMVVAARQSRNSKSKSRIIATYDYTDADGALLYQVLRYEPKDFRQRSPDGHGGFVWKLHQRRVIYRWPELLKFPDATVFVCEGEKDADGVAALGHCATTVAAGKWTVECVEALADRNVIILQDNDDAGRVRALAAARALHGTAASIRVVLLPGLPDKGDVSDWLDADPGRAEKLADVCFDVPQWTPDDGTTNATDHIDAKAEALGESTASNSWKFHSGEAPAPLRWLVKSILPENGVAIMSGQWGTFKTTAALDIAVCIMAGLPFADRYQVKRRGAVLYFALEGEGMLSAHLSAIAKHHGVSNPLPFAWRGDCPALTGKNAAAALCDIADQAAADLKRRFDLPVVLIWIDTLVAAADFASGEDNDSAATQRVMTALRTVSRRMGALVVGIDHFGKVLDTGTRGSSAKEGAADVVIALLANRELSGGVKNTRLAVRKQRDGVSGFEIPFTPRIVETGTDSDGTPITAPVIDWQATRQSATQSDARWTPSMQLLRRVLMTCLADSGQSVRPFLDGPDVRAVDMGLVRTEFYRQHPADGTEKQKVEARRKAFNRSLHKSHAAGLIASREVDGVQFIWLTKSDAATNV
jgi:AAA domain